MKKIRFNILLAIIVFLIIFIFFSVITIVYIIAHSLGYTKILNSITAPMTEIIFITQLSLVLTIIMLLIVNKIFGEKVKIVIESINRVANSDFEGNLEFKGIFLPKEAIDFEQSYNKMLSILKNTEIIQQDFINNFSHELKTPLTSIKGYSNLLRRENLTSEQREEFSDILLNEVDRLSNLTNNILVLSKLENICKFEVNIIYTKQLTDYVKQHICTPLSSERYFVFEIEEVSFWGNNDLLIQMFSNIINNSIKYSAEKTEICIKCYKNQNEEIEWLITDQGVGIEDEVIDKIFCKFYQNNPSIIIKGYGIGLSVVKRVVELHNGKIEVKSEVGIGTQFKIILPIKKL